MTGRDEGNDEDGDLANRRRDVGLGYGFGVFGGRFTAMPEVGLELSKGQREYRLGWRLELERGGPASMEFGVDATRHEAVNDEGEAVNAVVIRESVRWLEARRWVSLPLRPRPPRSFRTRWKSQLSGQAPGTGSERICAVDSIFGAATIRRGIAGSHCLCRWPWQRREFSRWAGADFSALG